MGFSSVYRVLQEVFPQVDSRALRAVAIEHSKDADVAVEVVLAEVMPFLSIQLEALPTSFNESGSFLNPSEAVEASDTTVQTDGALPYANGGNDGLCGDNRSNELISLSKFVESVRPDLSYIKSTTSISENDDHDQVLGNSFSGGIIFPGNCQERNIEVVVSDPISQVMYGVTGASGILNDHLHAGMEDLNGVVNFSIHEEGRQEQSSRDGNPLEMNNSLLQLAPSPVQECMLNASENSLQLVVVPVTPITDVEEPEPIGPFIAVPEKGISSSEMVDCENESTVNTMVTQPGRYSSVDLLEDINEDARSNEDMIDNEFTIHGECHEAKSSMDRDPLEMNSYVGSMANSPESGLQLQVMLDTPIMDLEKSVASDSCIAVSEKGLSASEMDDLEDEATMNTMVTRSGQICSIDLLEDIIENARSEKKTLRSAKDSVISLLREVELKEKDVEQANKEASRGGLGTLSRVEDLKQMLQRANEANDMHAGEVYGEKAILATEVRELQSRLLNLSDERVKALAILDEMSQTLEVRLTVAEKDIMAAEQEKLDKEESALKSLEYEESVMEKVVQESKILKQEAEENSKLREFLMDRGRLVDMLQGEISVICQDVKLMKEKFDKRIPLSKSLSSSQTSCVLASPSSSVKSVASDLPKLADSPETPEASATSSADDLLIENVQFPCGEGVASDRKALVDEGWEFFDNRELIM